MSRFEAHYPRQADDDPADSPVRDERFEQLTVGVARFNRLRASLRARHPDLSADALTDLTWARISGPTGRQARGQGRTPR